MTDTQRLYVGIGISTYSAPAFAELPKAEKDVGRLGDYLNQHRGYSVQTIPNPSEEETRSALKRYLKANTLPPGSTLVLLWAGHGEMAPEALHLIASDTEQGSAPDLTPESLASFVARCGATQALLLLDTCFSGTGVFDAHRVVDQVRREGADERAWLGVLASTLDFERARDGVFIDRLLQLLEKGPVDPTLQTRWSAHNEGVRGDDLMDALVKEWNLPGQRPKPAAFGDAWPMFPNPRFDPDAPERVLEHLLLAAEGRAPNEEGVYFTGRTAQLDAVVQWMQAGKPGVFVITGPAGSGKSAIAGRIVSLSNPTQRTRLRDAAPLDSPDPGEGAVDAHVHARRLTVDQVVEAIDQQLMRHGMLAPRLGGGARNRGELLGALERLERCPLLVLDGLDEAGEEAWAIAKDLVGLLAGSARLLIATRRLPSKAKGDPDLIQALAPRRIIDLGDPDLAEATQHDVAAYVRKRLAGHEPKHMDASKVAQAILRLSEQGDEGAFLLAQVTTSQLRAAPIDTSVPGWEGALSRSLEEAFDRDLARIEDPDGVRELLTALAWTYGSGLPDDLWPTVATALSSTGRLYSRGDVHTALGNAGRYIVEDGDGTRAVYRLSHQRLVQHLRPPAKPRELDASHTQAARVARALVDRYRDLLATGLQPSDRPYLWRYTWRHCADGGPHGIAALRELVEINAEAFLPDLAMALNNLGIGYSQVGRRQDAVAPTEEGVETYRTLAAENPAFLPNLAGSLNNLGVFYSEVGRRQDAVAPTEEAVRLRRTLAAENPAFLPGLASALNNLGIRYSEVGRRQDALAPSEEAVETYRILAEDNLAFLPDLASALNNLGAFYSEMGRRQDALVPSEEAVETYRTLAEDNPAFLPGLALALNNLGSRYSEVGRRQDAVAPTEEAVRTYRTLAAENPAFLPDLALALNNLGIRYGEVGRRQDAVAPVEEAVRLRRTLAEDNPAFLPDLALALNNLGNCYSEVGCRQDGLAPVEEAVETYRTLAEDNPAFLPGLASALNNLGIRYSEVGRRQDAVAPTEEAVRTYRTLAAENPAFLSNLAGSLSNLGNCYREVGCRQDALVPSEEAVETYRTLAEDNPAFLPGLALALNNLGICYSEVGRGQDALAPSEEAVETYRTLAEDNPAFRPYLSGALSNLGSCYSEVGRRQDALAPSEEAVETYRILAGDNPAFRPDLSGALSNLGICYSEVGLRQDALAPVEEAVETYRTLAEDNPAFRPGLASALNNLGSRYSEVGRGQDALAPSEEAVETYRTLAEDNPAFLPHLASALNNLGSRYSEVGRRQDALAPVEEAVRLRRTLTEDNPAFLPDLASALNNLGSRYREVGREDEIDSAWEEALAVLSTEARQALQALRVSHH
jgi:tetratricopeptide (TPR) repeat protein